MDMGNDTGISEVLVACPSGHGGWIIMSTYRFMSRDISVAIATGYGLDGRGSIPGKGKIFYSSS